MKFSINHLTAVLAATVALGACGSPEQSGTEAPASTPAPAGAPAEPEPAALPSIDTENARQFVQGGSTLIEASFPAVGSTTAEGQVKGYDAPVYAVPVAAGQTLTVAMETASSNLYFNVSEATDHSGAAVHRGEVDGQTATLTADRDMTYVIAPFQPRATARRDEAGDFTLTISRR